MLHLKQCTYSVLANIMMWFDELRRFAGRRKDIFNSGVITIC